MQLLLLHNHLRSDPLILIVWACILLSYGRFRQLSCRFFFSTALYCLQVWECITSSDCLPVLILFAFIVFSLLFFVVIVHCFVLCLFSSYVCYFMLSLLSYCYGFLLISVLSTLLKNKIYKISDNTFFDRE